MSTEDLSELVSQIKRLATRYRETTGRPLGVTGEIAELEAAQLLGLELAPPRQCGYDAIKQFQGKIRRYQIKSRAIGAGASKSQRVGSILLFDHEWDSVLLVLLDSDFNPTAIYEADRAALWQVLSAPGSKARNDRGQLGVSKFKAVSMQVWPKA